MKSLPQFLHKSHNRRLFLKGAGVSLLLPQLSSLASTRKEIEEPVRMAFLHVPNGRIMPLFRPKRFGVNYEITPSLKPIESFKNDFQIFAGLKHHKAESNGNGGGPHARAQGTFLTGVQVLKSSTNARAGVSVDQVAAQQLGHKTFLPSLELASGLGTLSGKCDTGYSCLCQYSLSWKNEKVPMLPEYDPAQAFKRLFTVRKPGAKVSKNESQEEKDKSVLDFMLENSKDLKKRGFKFVGATICYAYMQACGMVNDHTANCFKYSC